VYKPLQFDPKLHQRYELDIWQTYNIKYADPNLYTKTPLAPVLSAGRVSFTALATLKI
jgi:hypothetical protein